MESAFRDVKECAARSNDVNVDTLLMKLMHFDEVGRRTQHDDRELYSKVLERLSFTSHLRKYFGPGEEDFLMFLPYMGVAAILVK